MAVVAATIIAVVSLVLSCVAITMFSIDKSDGMNDDEIKRLDNYEKRLQVIELQLKTQASDIDGTTPSNTPDNGTPTISEIKPANAFQISTFTGDGPSYNTRAETAIDGNENNWTHTEIHTNPWWAADMGGIYHVKTVMITNRLGYYARRSVNLRVGVTNTSPVVGQSLALNASTLCGEKPGLMGEIGVVTCPDHVSGRYLIVQFQTKEYMNIAEVKIYGF